MPDNELNKFVNIIRSVFRVEDRDLINENTDLRTLKEWSSLQTMIIVSEIDNVYNVILGWEDIKKATNVYELFTIVETKKT